MELLQLFHQGDDLEVFLWSQSKKEEGAEHKLQQLGRASHELLEEYQELGMDTLEALMPEGMLDWLAAEEDYSLSSLVDAAKPKPAGEAAAPAASGVGM